MQDAIQEREELRAFCCWVEAVLQTLTDTTALEKKRAELQSEYDIVMELMRKCVEENARTKLNQEEYSQRYNALVERYQAAQNDIAETDIKLADRLAKQVKITRFLDDLKQRDDLLDEFDETLWLTTVESATVHSESEVTVTFKEGTEVKVEI